MQPLPDPGLPWPIAREGVALIAQSEGLRLTAYRCPSGVWTIGWGETDNVHPGDTCTKMQADRWLCDDLEQRTSAVRALCTVPPSDHELAALVSLAYNIGLRDDKRRRGLAHTTVLRQHNAGSTQAAARAFALLNKARNPRTGQLEALDGLTARRAREAALYLTPDGLTQPEPMPQAVEGETTLAASPIGQAGAVTAASGAVTAAVELSTQVQAAAAQATHTAQALGIKPALLLGLLLLASGLAAIYWRWRQRRDGWA